MSYRPDQPDPATLPGLAVLEFGTNWCGICRAVEPMVRQALGEAIPHLKVEDGPERRLGRHFRVKLWPTLVFLRDGEEVARVVRPRSSAEVSSALDVLLTSR